MQVLLALGWISTVTAQPSEPVAEQQEPMIVTASRAESIATSQVPSTVDTLTAETLRDNGIINIREAFELIPNVSISQADSARASSFSVRGSHEITFHEFTGGRTGVGFYLDDVPCADAYGRDLSLFTVERVSFYKGPHVTSFGVPHSMGVIEAVTRAPGEEFQSKASYSYGSHGLERMIGHVSGQIAPKWFLGIDGLYSTDDGWFKDTLTGNDYGAHETMSGRARLRWLPTDQLEFNLFLGLEHHDDDPAVFVSSAKTLDPYKLPTDPDAYARGGQNYQSFQALWKGDDWQVKSITTRKDSRFDDSDQALLMDLFSPFTLQRTRQQDVSTWSQEIRAESNDPDAAFRWRTGLFFSARDSYLDHFILGQGPWEGTSLVRYRDQDYAVYGEVTRRIWERLELSAGLRLQTTRTHTDSLFDPTPKAESLGGNAAEYNRHQNFDAVLPMAAARWEWAETQHSYLRLSTGLQPGGGKIVDAKSSEYDSERSFHYELGHDSSFHDEAIQLHAAAFYTYYQDYQSFQFNPVGQTIYNADSADAWGLESEIRIRPAKGLELSVGAGLTRARFDSFDTPNGDFSGNRISKIPSGTINLGCAYRSEWGGMARIDWRHIGKTWFDEGNTVEQPGYALLDARIGYEWRNFGAYLFGSNLSDTEYYSHSYLFRGVPASTPGMPRAIGAEVRATF